MQYVCSDVPDLFFYVMSSLGALRIATDFPFSCLSSWISRSSLGL